MKKKLGIISRFLFHKILNEGCWTKLIDFTVKEERERYRHSTSHIIVAVSAERSVNGEDKFGHDPLHLGGNETAHGIGKA